MNASNEIKLRPADYKAPEEVTLIAKDGTLYYPDTVIDEYGEPGPIVLCVYDAGDCDTIKWPNPRMKNLRRALYDDVETGLIQDTTVVRLPNGNAVVAWR